MSTATSLSVRALLNSAIARTGLAGRARAYRGLTPPAKALAVAAAAHASREVVVLYVVPADAELETATNDVRFFLASLEALSDAAAERVVAAVSVVSGRSVSRHGAALPCGLGACARPARCGSGHGARDRGVRTGAAAPAGCARIDPGDVVRSAAGVEIDPHALAEILVEGGYERQDPVDEHGEFSVRGGILDVFPAGEAAPVRIEFIGDSVESIRRFDPGTQRSIETLDQFQIVPVKEGGASAPLDQAPARLRSRPPLPPSSTTCARPEPLRIVVAEPEDVRAQIEKWIEQVAASFEQRMSDKTPRRPRTAATRGADADVERHRTHPRSSGRARRALTRPT